MQFLGPDNTPHIFSPVSLSFVCMQCRLGKPNCFLCKHERTRPTSAGTLAQGYISRPGSKEHFPKDSFLPANPRPPVLVLQNSP